MAITKHRTGQVVNISLMGAMASGTGAGALSDEVRRALGRGAARIILDGRGVSYLDASGLGELVACRAMARRHGARFVVRGVSGKALEAIRMTGLDRVLLHETDGPTGLSRHVA